MLHNVFISSRPISHCCLFCGVSWAADWLTRLCGVLEVQQGKIEQKVQFRGTACYEVVSRRLELLKLEGLGFSQAEIVNELSQKSSCTKRAVYKDFETRERWQPVLQSVVESNAVLLKAINRYEQIYRQASMGCFLRRMS